MTCTNARRTPAPMLGTVDYGPVDSLMRECIDAHGREGEAWVDQPAQDRDEQMLALLDGAHAADSWDQIIPDALSGFAASPRARLELVRALRHQSAATVYAWIMLALRRATTRTLEERWQIAQESMADEGER